MTAAVAMRPAKLGAGVFLLSVAGFAALYLLGVHQSLLLIPAVMGWAGALGALRPMVREEHHGALYFAFGVMAFLIFFLHETYEFQGKVRYFPLIVGWTGVLLSVCDIVSLTETRFAGAIKAVFGAAMAEKPGKDRTVAREIICFAAMATSVALIWVVGFLVAAPVFVFLWMRFWGRKALRHSFYGAVFTLAFIWVLFEQLLQYELFRGEAVLWLIDKLEG